MDNGVKSSEINIELNKFKIDISRYNRYLRSDGFSRYPIIAFLPYSKGYDEHPYWLIDKLEFIQSIIIKYKNDNKS